MANDIIENPKGANQRLKILYLYKILLEYTDDEHGLTMPRLIENLRQYGIVAARKALYEDIEALKVFGADIIYEKGKTGGYKIVSRNFELPELKLLADAVSSSRFLTEKKSKELVKKLETLTSIHFGKQIERQLYVSNRVKSFNELIYLNVDAINRAISEHKKIAFKYFDYDVKKQKNYRNGIRICSPYSLVWADERYYLVAYYEKYSGVSSFRVDRMEKVDVLEEKGEAAPDDFDLIDYLNSTFSMFSGASEAVKLRFDNSLVNPVIDRFGKNVSLYPDDSKHFTVTVRLNTEQPEPFFGWLFQFGTKAQIISPARLNVKYINMLKEVIENNQ
ncbi:MAG TPA: WYL domain-containing protein [Ruminococcaceae bacterium]|nr:WYL domain-containing protein [Oscillospiraceae bacterium]